MLEAKNKSTPIIKTFGECTKYNLRFLVGNALHCCSHTHGNYPPSPSHTHKQLQRVRERGSERESLLGNGNFYHFEHYGFALVAKPKTKKQSKQKLKATTKSRPTMGNNNNCE